LFPFFDLDDENKISYFDLIKLLQTCSITSEEKKNMLTFARDLLFDNCQLPIKSANSDSFLEQNSFITKDTFMVSSYFLRNYFNLVLIDIILYKEENKIIY
jgi:hypothetical protein